MEQYQEVSIFTKYKNLLDINIHILGRQWYYLQCTQMGLFQITDSVTWLPNRIEMEYHIQECQDVLGEE